MHKSFKKVMCKDCIYCEESICRRLPPTLRESSTAWPIVDATEDWCGKGISKDSVKGEKWKVWADKVKRDRL